VYVWRVERPLWPKTPAPVTPIAVTHSTAQKPVPLMNGDDGFDFLRDKNKP
jgi:hypothetical protein